MKDNKLSKYLSILVAVIAAVGAFLFIRVFMEDADAIENDPAIQDKVVNPIVGFSTALLYAAIGVTVLLSIWSVVKNPQNLKKLVLGLALLAVVLVISYFTASDAAVLDTQGVVLKGGEEGASSNKWVGTGITFSIILGAVASFFFVVDLVKGLIKS